MQTEWLYSLNQFLFIRIKCPSCIAANVAAAQTILPLYLRSTKETKSGSAKSMAPVTLFEIECTATNFFCTIKPEMMLIILISAMMTVQIKRWLGNSITGNSFIKHTTTKIARKWMRTHQEDTQEHSADRQYICHFATSNINPCTSLPNSKVIFPGTKPSF